MTKIISLLIAKRFGRRHALLKNRKIIVVHRIKVISVEALLPVIK